MGVNRYEKIFKKLTKLLFSEIVVDHRQRYTICLRKCQRYSALSPVMFERLPNCSSVIVGNKPGFKFSSPLESR